MPTVSTAVMTMAAILFTFSPSAGAQITGDSMTGEYFRVFVSYGVIAIALVMYEAKKRRAKSQAGRMLAEAQKQEEKDA